MLTGANISNNTPWGNRATSISSLPSANDYSVNRNQTNGRPLGVDIFGASLRDVPLTDGGVFSPFSRVAGNSVRNCVTNTFDKTMGNCFSHINGQNMAVLAHNFLQTYLSSGRGELSHEYLYNMYNMMADRMVDAKGRGSSLIIGLAGLKGATYGLKERFNLFHSLFVTAIQTEMNNMFSGSKQDFVLGKGLSSGRNILDESSGLRSLNLQALLNGVKTVHDSVMQTKIEPLIANADGVFNMGKSTLAKAQKSLYSKGGGNSTPAEPATT